MTLSEALAHVFDYNFDYNKMRTREEIQEEITESGAMNNGVETILLLQLETLLDIRDLLLASERRTQEFTDELQKLGGNR